MFCPNDAPRVSVKLCYRFFNGVGDISRLAVELLGHYGDSVMEQIVEVIFNESISQGVGFSLVAQFGSAAIPLGFWPLCRPDGIAG